MSRLRKYILPTEPINPLKDTVSYLVLVLTLIPGALALFFAGKWWRIVLLTIVVVGIILLIVRRVQAAFLEDLSVHDEKIRLLESRLEESQESTHQAKLAMDGERRTWSKIAERIVDYQVWEYEEDLEVIVTVGDDHVIEHHRTRPTHLEGSAARLPYRTCRPILPSEPSITYGDLGLLGRIDQANGMSIDVSPLQQTRHAIRVIAMFSPAMEEETAWTLEYESPGLWTPLRSTGVDELAWDTSSPGPETERSSFSSLRFVFVFPAGTKNMTVSEVSGKGEKSVEEQYELGPAIVWEVKQPPNHKYRWAVSCPDLRTINR